MLKRPEHIKTENAVCKLLDKPAVFTITYKDFGPHGWEFHNLECDLKHKHNRPEDCTCDFRLRALLSKPKM